MKFYVLDSGTKFYYEEIQKSRNPEIQKSVLFIHGAFQTSFDFRGLIESFPQNANYISINLTGFGKSKNENYQDIDIFSLTIQDLDDFWKKYNKDNPNLRWEIVAYSFGTYILINWLTEMMQMNIQTNQHSFSNIESIILCAPYGIFYNLGTYGYYWSLFFKYNIYGKCLKILNFFYKYMDYANEERNYSPKLIGDTIQITPNGHFVKNPVFKLLKKLEPSLESSSYSIPIYLIYGGQDTLIPYDQGTILQMLFPNLIKKCFVLKHSGHSMIDDDEFKQVLNHILFPEKNKIIESLSMIYSEANIWTTERKIREYFLKIL